MKIQNKLLKHKEPEEIFHDIEETNRPFIVKLIIYSRKGFYYGLKKYMIFYSEDLVNKIFREYEKIDDSILKYEYPKPNTLILSFLRISLNSIIDNDDPEFLKFFMDRVYSPHKNNSFSRTFKLFVEEEFKRCVDQNKLRMSRILEKYLREHIFLYDYNYNDLIP